MISWSTSDVAGLEFGDTHVAAVRLQGRPGGALELSHAGWIECLPGARPREVAAAIRELWRTARIPTRMVCSALRSAALVMRYFKVPAMSDAELGAALALQAEEALQLGRDQFMLDWHVGRSAEAAPGDAPFREGLLTAAPASDVKRQLEILHAAGLDPVIVDVRALAVANLYNALEAETNGAPVCLVHLTPHSADVVVRRDRDVAYPHTVYCRTTTWEESVPFLGENIRDVLLYSQYKLDWPSAEKVVLTGQLPAAAPLDAELPRLLDLPVETWRPVARLPRVARRVQDLLDQDASMEGRLVSGLGLALRRG